MSTDKVCYKPKNRAVYYSSAEKTRAISSIHIYAVNWGIKREESLKCNDIILSSDYCYICMALKHVQCYLGASLGVS